MTQRSTHPRKIALKDPEGRSDLTAHAYGPEKTEDYNIHSVTMLATEEKLCG